MELITLVMSVVLVAMSLHRIECDRNSRDSAIAGCRTADRKLAESDLVWDWIYLVVGVSAVVMIGWRQL